MLQANFDPQRYFKAVLYGRVSTDRQNPRSPDQQINNIKEEMARRCLSWTIVKVYRDDGISGRLTRKRPGFQQMLRDLKSRDVVADLVLVDTFERLSRAEDSQEIRRKIQRSGALVLTADSGFADPTSISGKALAMVESIRASEEGRVKAHNVLRGKKDAVRQKHWAGGPTPMGYQLQNVMRQVNGVEEIDHRVLEPLEDERLIIQEVFRLADECGFGATRIAKRLNSDVSIAEKYKPFHSSTIGFWLQSELYCGEYVWGKNCTGIVDDVRILQRLPESEWERVPEFCEPLVCKDRWNRVQELRRNRTRNGTLSTEDDEAPLVPSASGISLKHPLSGLVRCRHCARSMTASGSSSYVTKSGDEHRYVSYGCPTYQSGLCHNSRRISEPWLRQTIVELIYKRVFLDSDSDTRDSSLGVRPTMQQEEGEGRLPISAETLRQSVAFRDLLQQVRSNLDRHQPEIDRRRQRIEAELAECETRRAGFIQSLGNPNLPQIVRTSIEDEFARMEADVARLKSERAELEANQRRCHEAADVHAVAEGLNRLAETLAGANASATNLMLAQHIESIVCDENGKVLVRTCKLGCLAAASDLLSTSEHIGRNELPDAKHPGKPRRRARLNVGDAIEDEDYVAAANQVAVEPSRFPGLGPEWFHEDYFEVPRTLSWAEANARDVADYRLAHHATMEATAEHFGKSVPSIRAALVYARDVHGLDAFGKVVSQPKRRTWPGQNAAAVWQYFQSNECSMKGAVAHFGKSEPTIRKARELGRQAASDEAD